MGDKDRCPLPAKCIKTEELLDYTTSLAAKALSACTYPWEILPQIGSVLEALVAAGLAGYTKVGENTWIGQGVKIADTATLEGLNILGPGTVVRPGAYLRGNVLTGRDCVLGNSSEFKNCILLDHVQCPHYNYIGDSVLGCGAHTGAGAILSNLKSDHRNVTVHGEIDVPTGLRKFGAILADGADVGCGSVLNPGTVVGRGSRIYPITPVRGVIPPGCIVKSASEIVVLRED